MLERLAEFQISDEQAARTLSAALAFLIICLACFSRRSRRYIRRKAARPISRINPYLYLQGCKPLSRNEREVFRNLHLAVSPPLNVQFQTALSAMVTHDPMLPPESIGLVRATFNKLRVDFALYHFEAERYVAVVELDDRTHDMPEQKAEDARRDRILMAAGIKVVRVRFGADTTVEALAERFAGFIPHTP
jgi:hypothetical protein